MTGGEEVREVARARTSDGILNILEKHTVDIGSRGRIKTCMLKDSSRIEQDQNNSEVTNMYNS